jgi:hypothetical protein
MVVVMALSLPLAGCERTQGDAASPSPVPSVTTDETVTTVGMEKVEATGRPGDSFRVETTAVWQDGEVELCDSVDEIIACNPGSYRVVAPPTIAELGLQENDPLANEGFSGTVVIDIEVVDDESVRIVDVIRRADED